MNPSNNWEADALIPPKLIKHLKKFVDLMKKGTDKNAYTKDIKKINKLVNSLKSTKYAKAKFKKASEAQADLPKFNRKALTRAQIKSRKAIANRLTGKIKQLEKVHKQLKQKQIVRDLDED